MRGARTVASDGEVGEIAVARGGHVRCHGRARLRAAGGAAVSTRAQEGQQQCGTSTQQRAPPRRTAAAAAAAAAAPPARRAPAPPTPPRQRTGQAATIGTRRRAHGTHRANHILHPFARCRGHHRQRGAAARARREVLHQLRPGAARGGQVELVKDQDLRLCSQVGRKRSELGLDRMEGADDGGRAALLGRGAVRAGRAGLARCGAVQEVDQHAAAHAVR